MLNKYFLNEWETDWKFEALKYYPIAFTKKELY